LVLVPNFYQLLFHYNFIFLEMPPHIKSFLTNVVNIEQITGLSYEYTILRYVFAKYVL
jgi:hypothetical protein